MLPKALFMKEWKHASIFIWAIMIVFIIQFPIRISLKMEEWKKYENDQYFEPNIDFEIYSAFSGSIFAVLSIGLVLLLAGVFIGLERNSKRHDFSLALPYSKKSMFLTKWVLGFGSILCSFIINYGMGYFLILQSDFSFMLTELNLLHTFITPIFGYFVLFSFAMFIGSFAGEMKSQVVLSVIFLVFPVAIMYLLTEFWRIHGFGFFDPPEFVIKLLWPGYLMGRGIVWTDLSYPIIGGVIFFILSLWLFKKAPAEHSGEFLVFKGLEPLFKIGILTCSALLGGFIMSGLIPYGLASGINFIAYWIGALILASFAWVITKRLFGTYSR